jgi:hypothetical protein
MAKDRFMMKQLLDRTYKAATDKRAAIFSTILEREVSTGSSFLVSDPEGVPFLFVGLTQEVVPIPRARGGGDRFWTYMYRRYGLPEDAHESKVFLNNFRNHALAEGAKVAMRRFAAFNTKTQTGYMSCYNGQQWRIDGTDVLPIMNGDDDVFFIDDDGGKPIVPQIGPNGVLFERLIDPISFAEVGLGGITALQMKRAMVVWMFALAFPDMMPTKPLLIVEGAPGSGKSASLQLLQLALTGDTDPAILSANKPDDFGVILMRSPICIFDNLDAYVDWIPDKVCGYTTTGTFKSRKLYTDSEQITLRPHAFIAVASKNPSSFRREDTADRLIIMRLARRDSVGLAFVRLQALKEEIIELRPQLLGEYLHYVKLIIAEMRDGAIEGMFDERFRMGDFAALTRVVAKVLGWEDGAVEELLVAIQCEQTAFHDEADATADLLGKWLTRPLQGRGTNIGKPVEASVLHADLKSLAESEGIQFYKLSVLIQKLRSPHIERHFIITTAVDNGVRTYRIWRKTDARLTLVPETVASDLDGKDGNSKDNDDKEEEG